VDLLKRLTHLEEAFGGFQAALDTSAEKMAERLTAAIQESRERFAETLRVHGEGVKSAIHALADGIGAAHARADDALQRVEKLEARMDRLESSTR
jgi:hypothetical protein